MFSFKKKRDFIKTTIHKKTKLLTKNINKIITKAKIKSGPQKITYLLRAFLTALSWVITLMRNIIRRLATNIIILLIFKKRKNKVIKKARANQNSNYRKTHLTYKLTKVLQFKERSCKILQHYFLCWTFGIKTLELL